jgi:hypothetical protein
MTQRLAQTASQSTASAKGAAATCVVAWRYGRFVVLAA